MDKETQIGLLNGQIQKLQRENIELEQKIHDLIEENTKKVKKEVREAIKETIKFSTERILGEELYLLGLNDCLNLTVLKE